MNNLLDRGLIESKGRMDAPGRPMLYGTTDNFLRVFGINSVKELPEVEPIKVEGEVAGEVAVIEQLSLDIVQPEAMPEQEEIPEE